ncbi:hypothetical protein RJT34_24292 [Clitoria ternatea]|uniref:Uncharacterized protein n=1 Tax=Clitoria ternatea TaxID=43366 RepID=A0AAN9FMZ0_CLITE
MHSCLEPLSGLFTLKWAKVQHVSSLKQGEGLTVPVDSKNLNKTVLVILEREVALVNVALRLLLFTFMLLQLRLDHT